MRRPLAAFTFLAILGLAFAASAAPITYSLSYLPAGEVASLAHGYENVAVHDTGKRFSEPGAAGPVTLDVRNLATGVMTPLELLCTDVFDTYVSPGRYVLGRLSDTVHDPVKAGQIAALLENGLSRIADNASAAALQVAVWEIENEPGHANYNVGAGQFHVTGYGGTADPRMVADANADLANVTAGLWKLDPRDIVMQFVPVSGQRNQSFAYVVPDPPPSAAPEPSTLALFGVGAALAGWVGLRRRQKARDPHDATRGFRCAAKERILPGWGRGEQGWMKRARRKPRRPRRRRSSSRNTPTDGSTTPKRRATSRLTRSPT